MGAAVCNGQVNVEWLRENDIVKQLLRANLHQKQYVDQVCTHFAGVVLSAK